MAEIINSFLFVVTDHNSLSISSGIETVNMILLFIKISFYSKTYFHFALHFLFLTFQPKNF